MDQSQADEFSTEPILIQGGMGVAVSSWQLARAVSLRGQLGVVSGTAIEIVLARRLQQGDPGGHLRRALSEFPFPEMADRILDRYFIPGGKADDTPFLPTAVLPTEPTREETELVVVGNFVEVFLAKEGHSGRVGINFLEKIQPPTLPSLYGAMLAGVDYVLMGAGIPRAIPGILDRLSEGQPVSLPLNVVDAQEDDDFCVRFSPEEFTRGEVPWLPRPKFLAIVASATLATMLARKSDGRVNGFVVEGPTAGGHNAPPRGKTQLNELGEPVYGKRDVVDLEVFRKLGVPFWLAGSYGMPEQVAQAKSMGAAGVQVGTAFAFSNESGIASDIKRRVIQLAREDKLNVMTDPLASPTGFPFKILELEDTLSDAEVTEKRQRVCDLGFLRHGYRLDDGSIGWRCPSEPVKAYVHKGGDEAETVGRKCVCNGLMSTIGLAQTRGRRGAELPIVTSGNEVRGITRFLPSDDATGYSADDVIDHLIPGHRSESLQVDSELAAIPQPSVSLAGHR